MYMVKTSFQRTAKAKEEVGTGFFKERGDFDCSFIIDVKGKKVDKVWKYNVEDWDDGFVINEINQPHASLCVRMKAQSVPAVFEFATRNAKAMGVDTTEFGTSAKVNVQACLQFIIYATLRKNLAGIIDASLLSVTIDQTK